MAKFKVRKYFVYVEMGSSNIPLRSYIEGEIVDVKDPKNDPQMNRLEPIDIIEMNSENNGAVKVGADQRNDNDGKESNDEFAPIGDAPSTVDADKDRRLAAIAKLTKSNGAAK